MAVELPASHTFDAPCLNVACRDPQAKATHCINIFLIQSQPWLHCFCAYKYIYTFIKKDMTHFLTSIQQKHVISK